MGSLRCEANDDGQALREVLKAPFEVRVIRLILGFANDLNFKDPVRDVAEGVGESFASKKLH
jgi:hypothetical protein